MQQNEHTPHTPSTPHSHKVAGVLLLYGLFIFTGLSLGVYFLAQKDGGSVMSGLLNSRAISISKDSQNGGYQMTLMPSVNDSQQTTVDRQKLQADVESAGQNIRQTLSQEQ
jgi:hypothetical protein